MTRSPRPAEQLDARALARRHRDALRRRTLRIRRSVAGLALALFAAAFLIVYVQLASGHDPALVSNAARRAEAASETASESSGESGNEASVESGSETSGESSSSESGESGAGASAMTTSQS